MKRLLRLYPREWRDRYGEEFAALIDELDVTPALIADVAKGALVAHIDELVDRHTGHDVGAWTLTRRGEWMVRIVLGLLAAATTAVGAFAAFHAISLDRDESPLRAFAAISFAVPAVIGAFTLIALARAVPGSRQPLARAAIAAGILLIAIGVVGGLNVVLTGMRTGDYEGWVATVDAALVAQGALTALYFSGRTQRQEPVGF